MDPPGSPLRPEIPGAAEQLGLAGSGGISAALLAHLEHAQEIGAIGAGSLVDHIAHADAFVNLLRVTGNRARVIDLGSGAGLPGLIIAERLPDSELTLLDGRVERARMLEAAVAACGMADRVQVVGLRAEIAGRQVELRGTFDAATARAFARPAVTAECAAPFLRPGGVLIVAEPPDPAASSARWPKEQCAEFGLEPRERWEVPYALQLLHQIYECPVRFPRRTGIPEKRPLF